MEYGAFYVICPRASSQSVTPLLKLFLFRQGGVMQSLLLIRMSVFPSVSRITHEGVYKCRPNMVGVSKE